MLVDTKKFPYKVEIPWRKGDSVSRWDKVCVQCVVAYGLPGDKYMTSSTQDNMTFYFKDEKDALWFRLTSE